MEDERDVRKQRFEYVSCKSKRAYPSFQRAATEAARWRIFRNGPEQKIYHCKFCNQYHTAKKS